MDESHDHTETLGSATADQLNEDHRMTPAADERIYARVLSWGTWLGLTAMLVAFVLYLTGVAKPIVPISDLPEHWGQSVEHYQDVTHVPSGWAWAGKLAHGDFLVIGAIALLAAVTVAAYLSVLPLYIKRREWLFVGIIVLELGILALAASGVVSSH